MHIEASSYKYLQGDYEIHSSLAVKAQIITVSSHHLQQMIESCENVNKS